MRTLVALLGVALALCVAPTTASAHAIGLSRGDYQRARETLDAALLFARGDVLAALPEVDQDHDGRISASELARGEKVLGQFALQALLVTQGEHACTGEVRPPTLTDEDGLLARISFRCEKSGRPISVELAFLRLMGHGHRHRAVLSSGTKSSEAIYFGTAARIEVPAFQEDEATWRNSGKLARLGYLRMGFEHILSGADHVAFLFALVLGSLRPLRLLRVVSAFTLGHSLSLAAVALGWFSPNTSWVEPGIALSVAYVGFENSRSSQSKDRALITFVFGLVHGMGFGGALNEIHVPRDEIPGALALFNIGVELAQIALICALLPLLAVLRKTTWFSRRGQPACALALGACGLLWFAARLANFGV